MSAPPPTAISERSIIPVKGGVDDWKEPYKQFLLTLKDQPGFIRTRWGPRSEDMNVIDLLTGWDSPESRDAFYASAAHTAAMKTMEPVLNGAIVHYGLKFTPYAPQGAINAPIVQVVTMPDVPATVDEAQLRATVAKGFTLPGSRSGGCGFCIDASGQHSRTFVAVIGWDGKEAADQVDRTEYIPKDVGEVEIHHVNFLFPIKGFSVTNSN